MDFLFSSFAAALCMIGSFSPEVPLLDEPLANIDRETASVLEAVIASLPARGTTVVMTTHAPDPPGCRGGGSIELDGGKVAPLRDLQPA